MGKNITIEERANKALDAMGDNCYIFCCSEAVSAYIDGFTDGAISQQKIDTEKAIEWMKNNGCFSFLQEGSQTIEDVENIFRKTMNE